MGALPHLMFHFALNSLWCRSHYEMEACLTQNASGYCPMHPSQPHYFLSPAGRCSSMDFTKSFKKETEKSYRCFIPVPVTDDNNVTQEKERGASGERFQWSRWRGLSEEQTAVWAMSGDFYRSATLTCSKGGRK